MNKYPDWGPAPIKNSGCNNITGIKHNVQPGITAPPHPPQNPSPTAHTCTRVGDQIRMIVGKQPGAQVAKGRQCLMC